MKLSVAVTLAVSLFAAPALAQDKPQDKAPLSAFLAQGFQVIHSEIGNWFGVRSNCGAARPKAAAF